MKSHCSSSIFFLKIQNLFTLIYFLVSIEFGCCWNILMAHNGVPPKCTEKGKKHTPNKQITATETATVFLPSVDRSMWFIVFCSSIFNLKFAFSQVYTCLCRYFFFSARIIYANYKALKFHTKQTRWRRCIGYFFRIKKI